MSDYIGNIAVPEITPSGTFPIVPDYGYGQALAPDVVVHQFGSGNAKIEQRYLLGTGARRFLVRRAFLKESDRNALRDFWEQHYGPYGAFYYNAPNDDGNGTTQCICRFANEPLSWEMVADWACSIGVTLIEVPSSTPTYSVTSTVTRFPSVSLQQALLAQVQEIIPLVKIQPLQSGYPAIFVSDRRCIVGGQLYQARLLEFDGISQSIGSESDEAQFTFGNADRVMRDLVNDVDLYRASIEFSLFHVGTGIKLDLWKGNIVDWQLDSGPEFKVTAADGLYELNLPYPVRKISRSCWKQFKGPACPYVGPDTSCDKGFDTPNGCRQHGMDNYFGGIVADPQAVRIKDNSTGVWGWGRSTITSVSLIADSIYDQVLPEIYTDSSMPVNCKIAAGREEGDFYDALGIVGAGPIGAYGTGHLLDNQPNHGPGSMGLRTSLGNDPNPDSFSLGQGTPQVWGPERAAGTAFIEIRRTDQKGFQPTPLSEHQMQAVVTAGMSGWVWTAPGTRSRQLLTNPIWIAVNMLLRARGLQFADAATCEQFFDVDAAIAAAQICDQQVSKLVGSGYETQFKFRGILQEEKPLRDWLQEVLMNCLGYYTFAFGKLKLGVRINSSSLEAFTEGNILFQSLQLSPLKPSFNHLTANFADEEFNFVANSISLYDIDHATFLGGGAGPLFLKSTVNLSGTASKSQAARIVTTRLREELGGTTLAEWKAARQISFKTTVLALNTEPGMVCSMTHPSMPSGSGEFRVTSWRLNKDYSIDIQGRTTTDSMYDVDAGPKPADVPAEPVSNEAYFRSAPDVLIFKAGKSNGDGTFESTMYWDSQRQMMLIDWGCVMPLDTSNWGGVQIWLKTPDGSGGYKYSQATGTITPTLFEQFDNVKAYYDTIAIGLESVPDPPQTWSIIAVSLSRFGVPNTDSNGNPTGVSVDLPTLSKSDYVSGFSASVLIEVSESGDQLFRIAGSWTNAPIPRYKAVKIIMRGMTDDDVVLAIEGEGSHSFRTDAWPLPETTKVVQIYATPVFGDGTTAPIIPGTTPMVQLTISRLGGTTGKEYCELVTGFSASVATPAYSTNADGQKVLRINFSWTNPSDVRFGGVAIFANWYDGTTIQVTGFERGTSLKWQTSSFPTTSSNVTFYALSVDTNNRRNTYQSGITPSYTLTLPSPSLGSAGSEYTSNVSGFSVSVSYPTTADGSYVALVTATFIPPSDPTWGGVQIRATEDGGMTFPTRVDAKQSPVTFELTPKQFAQTFSIYAVSYDVNGRSNSISTYVTPRQDIIVGTSAGQLDFSKAKATTYDPNIFTISSGQFRVWAMDGSLIVTGTISSAKLNATEISVGGGGSKPGKFGIYNASGQQIGFIGVESSYEGGWFKTLRVGGTDKSNAPLVADSSGNLSINGAQITVSGTYGSRTYSAEMKTTSGYAAVRSYSTATGGGESWLEDGEVAVVSNVENNRYPEARMYRTSSYAGYEAWGDATMSSRFIVYVYASSVTGQLGLLSLDRRIVFSLDNGSDPYIDFRCMSIKADGYAGQTVTISYLKPDNSTGTLGFRRGLLTSYS